MIGKRAWKSCMCSCWQRIGLWNWRCYDHTWPPTTKSHIKKYILKGTFINACNKFSKIFNKCLGKLYKNIYNDFRQSKDMWELLQNICKCLNVTYWRPKMFVVATCLPVCGVTLSAIYIFKVFNNFTCHFWVSEIKSCISPCWTQLFRHKNETSDEMKMRIKACQNVLKKRNTWKLKQKEERISEKHRVKQKKASLCLCISPSAL